MTEQLARVEAMDAEEARIVVDSIRRDLEGARAKLLELYERQGWRALGYASWRECVVAEFQQSQAHLYRQLEAARVERELEAEISPMGETLPALGERHLRAISQLEDDQRREIALELARGELEPRDLRQLVAEHRLQARDPNESYAPPVPRPDSVFESDPEALETLLGIHLPEREPPLAICDVTHNAGRMWHGVSYQPDLRLDIDPWYLRNGQIDKVCDFRELVPVLGYHGWGCLVFDPPHLTDSSDGAMGEDAAQGHRSVTWNERYGLGGGGPKGASIEPLFEPFLAQAFDVLVPRGIVIAKISNMVHSSRYQDQARAFKNAAERNGLYVEDEAVKVSARRGVMLDPKWKQVLHVRVVHTYFIVLRSAFTGTESRC